MAKDTLITLLSAMQIETGVLLLFSFALSLGLRSRLSKSTQKRIFVGFLASIAITFLALVIVAYLNDMIDTSGWGQSQSNVRPMFPIWLIALILILLAAWKIKNVLRYRRHHSLFIQEVAGDKWIDRNKLKDAIRYYIYLESYFFISLPFLVALIYVKPLVPYIWHIVISFLVSNVVALVWWDRKFSIKKSST